MEKSGYMMRTVANQRLPIYKQIGLTLKQYRDSNYIKDNEKIFVKKFTRMGYEIKWIPRDKMKSVRLGYLPTNDFIWRGKEWELKSPKVKKYNSIFNMIRRGARKGKKNFIIDLWKSVLRPKLLSKLSTYNIRNFSNPISVLYVVDKESLTKVFLIKEVRKK